MLKGKNGRRRALTGFHLLLLCKIVLIKAWSLWLFYADTKAHWFHFTGYNSISSNLSYDNITIGTLILYGAHDLKLIT